MISLQPHKPVFGLKANRPLLHAHQVRLNRLWLRTLPVSVKQRYDAPPGRLAETHLVRLNIRLRTLPVSWRPLSQRAADSVERYTFKYHAAVSGSSCGIPCGTQQQQRRRCLQRRLLRRGFGGRGSS